MKCQYCSEEIGETSAFCPYCGHSTNNNQQSQTYMQSFKQTISRPDGVFYEPPIRKALGFVASAVMMLSLLFPIVTIFTALGQFFDLLDKASKISDLGNMMGVNVGEHIPGNYILAIMVFFVGAIVTIVMTIRGVMYFVKAVQYYNRLRYACHQYCAYALTRFAIGEISFLAGMILMLLISGLTKHLEMLFFSPSMTWVLIAVIIGAFVTVSFLNRYSAEAYRYEKANTVQSAAHTPAPSANGIWVCSCGAHNRTTDNFCTQCGKNR